MDNILTVGSWVAVGRGCPISYRLDACRQITFHCGPEWDGFEFVFDAEALREFVSVASTALDELAAERAS